jgi:hypothetical protein
LLSLASLLAACAGQAAPPKAAPTPATSPSAASTDSALSAPTTPGASAASTAAAATTPADPSTSAPASPPAATAPTTLPALPKGTFVLQLGDSFAAALGIELGKRLKAAGLRTALEYKTASYIPNWSFGGDIPQLIGKYHPDLVLVTLGANEIEIPNPEHRAGAIKHLVSELGGRPCVWVLPPLWKQDTGLIQVIKDNVAPCRYLDSNALVHDLPRGPDKIHPNSEGREIWAETVFEWLAQERVGSEQQPWAFKAEPARAN